MASLYPKKVGGKTYWYLREMARVDGKPKMGFADWWKTTAADRFAKIGWPGAPGGRHDGAPSRLAAGFPGRPRG